MEIKMLSAKNYTDKESNYGDCFIINDNENYYIYDCGSEAHAERVLDYLSQYNINNISVILSHNDADHYNGIPKLLESGKVKKVYTLLLLKYVDELLDEIDDKRKSRESIKKQIIETYSNIYEMGNYDCELIDAIATDEISPNLKCVGPSKDYFIKATAKLLNTSESDTIDSETICNATSIQVEALINGKKLLLTGDSNFTAIEDKITEYDLIQLPHHGKVQQAEEIFLKNQGRNQIIYYVSDNTGNTNGGSDNLDTTGHIVKNTKDNDDITIDTNNTTINPKGSYGLYD